MIENEHKYKITYGDENVGEIHIKGKEFFAKAKNNKSDNMERLKRLFLLKNKNETPQEFLENMHLRPYKGYVHVNKIS